MNIMFTVIPGHTPTCAICECQFKCTDVILIALTDTGMKPIHLGCDQYMRIDQ